MSTGRIKSVPRETTVLISIRRYQKESQSSRSDRGKVLQGVNEIEKVIDSG